MIWQSTRRRLRHSLFGLLILFAACSPTRGCIESSFNLSPESRIPKWFTLPHGVQRADVTVTLSYYAGGVDSQRTATITLWRGWRWSEVDANLRGREPLTLEPHSDTGRIPYPMYEVLTANGISEVIEHRRMEPIFYINDDPEVRRKLGVMP